MSAINNNLSLIDEKTFFKRMQFQFPFIENDKIETEIFLEASKHVVQLIEQLGTVFAPVKYDMNNNIHKIYSVYEKEKNKNKFIEDLILFENERNENHATISLLWLKRALHFLLNFLECIVDAHKINTVPSNLQKFLKISYTEVLMPYHGWITQQIFHFLCKRCLTKKQFFEILACKNNIPEEIIIIDMECFNRNLKQCITNISIFYTANKLENNERV